MSQGEVVKYEISKSDMRKYGVRFNPETGRAENLGEIYAKLAREKGFVPSMGITKEDTGETYIFRQFRPYGPIKNAEA